MRLRRCAWLHTAIVVAAVGAGLAAAQPAGTTASAALLELTAQEQVLLDELEVIETRLLVLHTELQSLHTQERELESQLVALDREAAVAAEGLDRRREAVRRRARALYMHSDRGFLQLLFSARNLDDLLLGNRYLAHVLRHDEQALEALSSQRAATDELLVRREEEYQQLHARIADRRAMQEDQRELRQRRSNLLARVRSDRRSVALDAAAADHGEDAVSAATTVHGDEDADVADGDATTSTGDEQPPDAGVVDTALMDLGFARQQGRLIMPTPGDVIGTFGWYRIGGADERAFRRGIAIAASRGDPIRAVYAGQVRRAEWIRGFGNVVILDHGNAYYTVYAHLDDFSVAVGEMVSSGQVIAHAGETGSMNGPYLHFEIRHDGQPVDPLDWIDLPPGIQVKD